MSIINIYSNAYLAYIYYGENGEHFETLVKNEILVRTRYDLKKFYIKLNIFVFKKNKQIW